MVVVEVSFVQLEMKGEGERWGGRGAVVLIGQSVHAPNPMSALSLDNEVIRLFFYPKNVLSCGGETRPVLV